MARSISSYCSSVSDGGGTIRVLVDPPPLPGLEVVVHLAQRSQVALVGATRVVCAVVLLAVVDLAVDRRPPAAGHRARRVHGLYCLAQPSGWRVGAAAEVDHGPGERVSEQPAQPVIGGHPAQRVSADRSVADHLTGQLVQAEQRADLAHREHLTAAARDLTLGGPEHGVDQRGKASYSDRTAVAGTCHGLRRVVESVEYLAQLQRVAVRL